MYIISGVNQKYCYICETIWDKTRKEYYKSKKCIGYIDSDDLLIPNRYLAKLFMLEASNSSSLTDYEKIIIST